VSGSYLSTQRILGFALLLVGVAMIVSAIARGGGPLALGIVVGVLFAALGVARLFLARAVSRPGDR
jgi:drug/metabolite transporter (DMT)-like permease